MKPNIRAVICCLKMECQIHFFLFLWWDRKKSASAPNSLPQNPIWLVEQIFGGGSSMRNNATQLKSSILCLSHIFFFHLRLFIPLTKVAQKMRLPSFDSCHVAHSSLDFDQLISLMRVFSETSVYQRGQHRITKAQFTSFLQIFPPSPPCLHEQKSISCHALIQTCHSKLLLILM